MNSHRLNSLLADSAFRLGYREELDGLRCVAVLMVLIFHGAKSWMPGGWVGVDIFFVLSGFLITTLLLAEFQRFGRVNLKAFYLRRALRLFPALYCMLTAAFVFSFFLPEPHQTTIRGEIAAAGLHVWNYGAQLGFWKSDTTWLYHTWSLSTEEQFYLVWPFLLSLMLLKRLTLRVALLLTVSLYALFSAYGTILVGCILAMIYPSSLSPYASKRLSQISMVAVLFLVYVALSSPPTTPLTRGSIALASATVILYLMKHPDTRITGLLKTKTVVFVGKISYGVYLWHLLVFKVLYFAWGVIPSGYHKVIFLVKIGASFIVALLSYYLVERPFLKLKKRYSPRDINSV